MKFFCLFTESQWQTADLPRLNCSRGNKKNSTNKLIAGHFNINSPRNKCEILDNVIDKNPNVILLLESNFNDSFPATITYRFDVLLIALLILALTEE